MKVFDKIIIILLIIVIAFLSFLLYSKNETETTKIPEDTAIQIASSITVLRPSFMTYSQIQNVLKGTKLAGLETAFLKAEELSGIGADYLIAIAAHESGWGTGYYAQPPWNQIFSWGIWDSGPRSEGRYPSKEACLIGYYKIENGKQVWVDGVPVKITKLYLTKGGTYYSGETLSAIGKYYASDSKWASSILSIHNQVIKNLPESALAKQFVMETKIIRGNLPSPYYFTDNDYWSKPISRQELAIFLWRINNAK